MEIILAIVVASAVIFFGALISMGNERQRKAIEGLREQVVLWAIKDLQIKREHLAQTVQVPDLLGWLNKVTFKVSGFDLDLQTLETFEEPQVIVCSSADGLHKVILTALHPSRVWNIRKNNHAKLDKFTNRNPLFYLPKHSILHELNVLNCGILFDIELALVWKEITGKKLETVDHVWMYLYD